MATQTKTQTAATYARNLAAELDLPLVVFRTGGNDGTSTDPDTVFGIDSSEKLERVVRSRQEARKRKR